MGRAAEWISLAATPIFGVLAILSLGNGADMLCAQASPLGGMAMMYLLMGAVHLAPWLKRFAGRRHARRVLSLTRDGAAESRCAVSLIAPHYSAASAFRTGSFQSGRMKWQV